MIAELQPDPLTEYLKMCIHVCILIYRAWVTCTSNSTKAAPALAARRKLETVFSRYVRRPEPALPKFSPILKQKQQ